MGLLDNCDPDRSNVGRDIYAGKQRSWMMEYKYEVGKEYKTRGGFVATILDVNYKGGGGYKIAGKINKDGREEIVTWQSDGLFLILKDEHPYDLMPPVETKELWVNVFTSHVVWWGAKDDAMRYMLNDDRIGTIHIVIEGGDFTIEKVSI